MVKQYVIEHAYDLNYSIHKYIDGQELGYVVMSSLETEGYIYALEEQGYTRAYDVDKARKEMKQAKLDYELAVSYYEMAKKNALIKIS